MPVGRKRGSMRDFWGKSVGHWGDGPGFRPKAAGSSGSGLAKASGVCHIRHPLANTSESVQCRPLEVQVGDKGIERAIKHLKRKMAAEGILRELKRRRHYMKPSIKKRKKMSEAARRRRKRLKTDEIPRTMG
jgi:small subunit ribosomal protein S21